MPHDWVLNTSGLNPAFVLWGKDQIFTGCMIKQPQRKPLIIDSPQFGVLLRGEWGRLVRIIAAVHAVHVQLALDSTKPEGNPHRDLSQSSYSSMPEHDCPHLVLPVVIASHQQHNSECQTTLWL